LYIDRRLGVKSPDGFPFNINSAVDELLKREFDKYRTERKAHPYMVDAGINAIPYQHAELDKWRANFTGVQYLHKRTNLLLHGAIDDIWQADNGELIVVDYKATSKNGQVNIDADWQIAYKRQMEFYQWLLRMNEFNVSNTGYFVYCNGKRKNDMFDKKIEFDVDVIPYVGNDDWVDRTIQAAFECLNQNKTPDLNEDCDQCKYNREINKYY